jgi:hypothetical protein
MSEYPAGSTAKTYTGEDGVEISLREFVGIFPVQAVSLIRQQEIIISDTKAEKAALMEAARVLIASQGQLVVESQSPVDHMYLTVSWVAFSGLANLLPPLPTTPEGE